MASHKEQEMKFIYFLIISIIALVLTILFMGCASTKTIADHETTTETTTITIQDHEIIPPAIQDTFYLATTDTIQTDTSTNYQSPLNNPPSQGKTVKKVYKGKHGDITTYNDKPFITSNIQPDGVRYTDTNKYKEKDHDRQIVKEKAPGFIEAQWIKLKNYILGILFFVALFFIAKKYAWPIIGKFLKF